MNVVARNVAVARLWWSASAAALLLVLAVLAAIFGFVFIKGIPALRDPAIFVTVTSGVAGGLANAIVGTIMLVAGGVLLVTVIGIGTALWVTEFAPAGARRLLRFVIDVLAGVPSIVVGYFLYVALVVGAGWGFSLAAGAIALAIIMLPYVVRAADLALSGVPRGLREAAFALGARPVTVAFSIALPWALPGILTGILVATGIGLGETAPLIYTAGWSNFMPRLAFTHAPVAYLTYVVWSFINMPFERSHALAYAAAALLMIAIFVLNLVSRTAVDYWVRRTRGRR